MLGKFKAQDYIAIAGEMRQFPASNENTEWHNTIKISNGLDKVVSRLDL
jgi:fido (protein-threonine AMPylation protein)